MLLPQSTYCSEGVADFNVMIDGDDDGDDDDDDVDDHDDCKCGATSGLGRIVFYMCFGDFAPQASVIRLWLHFNYFNLPLLPTTRRSWYIYNLYIYI